MREMLNPTSSEKAPFDPEKMANLEWEFINSRVESGFTVSDEYEAKMLQEQFGLDVASSKKAISLLNNRKINSYFTIISNKSGLNFDPAKAQMTYLDMMSQMSNTNPVPAIPTLKLLGVIYSIDIDNANLRVALAHKSAAYRNRDDSNLFKFYLTDYYRHLKMAVNHPKDNIISS